MISLLITLLIYCLFLYLVWWILTLLPLPAPFEKVKQVVFAILCLLVLLSLVTGLVPLAPLPVFRR